VSSSAASPAVVSSIIGEDSYDVAPVCGGGKGGGEREKEKDNEKERKKESRLQQAKSSREQWARIQKTLHICHRVLSIYTYSH